MYEAKEKLCKLINKALGVQERVDPQQRKVALVVEGGAMGAVVSGGMMLWLERMGLNDGFDFVIGASAGALSAPYFVAKQAREGLPIYWEHINNGKFIKNPLGFLLFGRPLFSLEYLVDEVYTKKVPLDFEAVLQSGKFVAVATDVETGGPVALSNFKSAEEIKISIKASACLPVLGGPPVEFRGDRLWDPILSEPIPVVTAKNLGCTDVVVLLSSPVSKFRRNKNKKGTHWTPSKFIKGLLMKKALTSLNSEFPLLARKMFYAGVTRHKMITDEIEKIKESGVRVVLVEPKLRVSMSEKRAVTLQQGAQEGFRAISSVFGVE